MIWLKWLSQLPKWVKWLAVAVAITGGAFVAYKAYETYRARKYEEKLQKLQKKYKETTKERYKEAGLKIFNRIRKVLSNACLPDKERKELKDIVKRHAEWVYA